MVPQRATGRYRNTRVWCLLVEQTQQELSAPNIADVVFARQARQYRERAGLTQRQVAERMSTAGFRMHHSTVAKIEAGTRPVIVGEAAEMARVLGVSIESLMTEKEPLSRHEMMRMDLMMFKTRVEQLERVAAERLQQLQAAQTQYDEVSARLDEARHERDLLSKALWKEMP